MPFVTSGPLPIAYLDEGEGDAILLIHGFASNKETNWVSPGWVKTLTTAGYRVLALDNRGHGESGKSHNKQDYHAPLMAEDALRVLDHAGLEAAHIMGYSMGARISAFVSLNAPERVKTVTFGGLGINMVRGIGGAEMISQALLGAFTGSG
jgi:pimeloyl-ACP methyl ester carboxylesterase